MLLFTIALSRIECVSRAAGTVGDVELGLILKTTCPEAATKCHEIEPGTHDGDSGLISQLFSQLNVCDLFDSREICETLAKCECESVAGEHHFDLEMINTASEGEVTEPRRTSRVVDPAWRCR